MGIISFRDFHFASLSDHDSFHFHSGMNHFHYVIFILAEIIILTKSQNHSSAIHFHSENGIESGLPPWRLGNAILGSARLQGGETGFISISFSANEINP